MEKLLIAHVAILCLYLFADKHDIKFSHSESKNCGSHDLVVPIRSGEIVLGNQFLLNLFLIKATTFKNEVGKWVRNNILH